MLRKYASFGSWSDGLETGAATTSVQSHRAQPRLIESGVVAELMDHRSLHLPGELLGVREVLFEGQPEDGDLVRDLGVTGAVGDRRDPLVEPVERVSPMQLRVAQLLVTRLVVDNDSDVLEQLLYRQREAIECLPNEYLEGLVTAFRPSRQRHASSWIAARLPAAAFQSHVPMLSSVPHEPDSLVVTTDTGDRIHYLDWGGNARALPPLLLIHGLAATAWGWTPVARRLVGQSHVLAMDLRGHGLSESPRHGYDLESLAFDALTVLAANGYGVEVDGPRAVVAGHGLGAMVAAAMGFLQPESIAAVALVDGGWEELAAATGMSAADFERTTTDPPEVMSSMAAYLADRRDFDLLTWDTDQEQAARAAVDEKHAGHVGPVTRPHAMRGAIAAMFDYRPIETLAGLAMPLQIAVAESGAADDESARERHLALEDIVRARAAAGLPAPDVRHFPGAGHNLMRYRPAELSAALTDLLNAGQAHQRS